MQDRPTADECFLDIALNCAHRGTCRRRNYGAVLVDIDRHIVSTGYTGSPSGTVHCSEKPECWREKNKIPSGSDYSKCFSVHGETNALLQAGPKALGATIYVAGYEVSTGLEVIGLPCFMCTKLLVNAGVETVAVRRLNADLENPFYRAVYFDIIASPKSPEASTVYLDTYKLYEYQARVILS